MTMTLDQIVQLGVALGSSSVGLSSVIAAGAYALRKRSDAQLARANAERVAAETKAAAEERVDAMLAGMRADLDDAKAEATAARIEVSRCMERHDEERRERERVERESHDREAVCRESLARLEERLNRLTPQPMRAVSEQ